MPINSLPKINQKEYLKKYLSGDKLKKKKSKKHRIKSDIKVKIIDDDAGALPEPDIDEELVLTGEDAPQIVATYFVEDTKEGNKWKSIAIKEEESATELLSSKGGEELWGPKPVDRRIRDEFSPPRGTNRTNFKLSVIKSEPKSPVGYVKSPLSSISNQHNESKDPRPSSRGHSGEESSAHYRRMKDSLEESPPRRRSVSADQSPQRRRRKGRTETQSPRRLKEEDRFRDRSPLHQNKYEEYLVDQSPPRRRRQISTDQISSRKHRKTSSDYSPLRHKGISDFEGQKERDKKRDKYMRDSAYRYRRDADSTFQTLNKNYRKIGKPNLELSNSEGQESLKSPSKIKIERPSPDLYPVKKLTGSHQDKAGKILKKGSISPGRDTLKSKCKTTEFKRFPRKSSPSLSPPPTHKPQLFSKTLDGKRTGLQNAETLRQECLDRRLKEEKLYAQMPTELLGRDAEVQVRSYGRRGKRAEKAQNIDPEEERQKEAHEQRKQELYERWGKGLKQIEEYRAKVDQDSYEGSKPLARYSNDGDLEKYLRDQERPDDPMLEYMRRKRKDQQPHKKTLTIPTYQGIYPENRFGIRPGYRWDGVDRSNGYEKRWFDIQNEKQAKQDEAYKYSVEDL